MKNVFRTFSVRIPAVVAAPLTNAVLTTTGLSLSDKITFCVPRYVANMIRFDLRI